MIHCTAVAALTAPTLRTFCGKTSLVTMYGTGPRLTLKAMRNTKNSSNG